MVLKKNAGIAAANYSYYLIHEMELALINE